MSLSCKGKRCSKIPEYFNSTDNSIQVIKESNFRTVDSVKIFDDDWMAAATFYSCNGKIGYLIFRFKQGDEKLNPKVPFSLWKGFKESPDKRNYYENEIRKKFLVPIIQDINK
jgi:hypothetical protein